MKGIFIPEMKDRTIGTVQGEARYYITEMENQNEQWNDSYCTSDGYYVIHADPAHHVYKVVD